MKSTSSRTGFALGGDRSGVFAVALPVSSAKESPSPSLTQLIVRDSSGQIAERWPINQTKCTIGSTDGCSVKCSLPGIEPLNAVIVLGVRQAFVRGLVPNLSQDGVAVNELLLTEQKNYFELAGHRFEFLREPNKVARRAQQPSRLRFTTARPFDLSNSTASGRYAKPTDRDISGELADAPWLKSLIERTFEPLESQIASLLMPVAEFQNQVMQSQDLQKAQSTQQQQKQAELAKEISSIVAKQSATMETLGERLRDVNQQLASIERIIAEDSQLESKAKDDISQDVSIQRTAIEQLQNGMVAVTDSLNQLHDRQQSTQLEHQTWKEEVQRQLGDLSHVVNEIKERTSQGCDSEILEAVHSLQQTQQLAQEEVQRWQYGLQEHLENIEKRISESTYLPAMALAAESLERQQSADDQKSPTDDVRQSDSWLIDPTRIEPTLNSSPDAPASGIALTSDLPSVQDDWLDQWSTIQPTTGSSEFENQQEEAPIPELIDVAPERVQESHVWVASPEEVNLPPVDSENPTNELANENQWDQSQGGELNWAEDTGSSPARDSYSPTIVRDSDSFWEAEVDESSSQPNLLNWNESESPNSEIQNSVLPYSTVHGASATESDEFFFGSESIASQEPGISEIEIESPALDSIPASKTPTLEPVASTPQSSALPSWWTEEELEEQDSSHQQPNQNPPANNQLDHSNLLNEHDRIDNHELLVVNKLVDQQAASDPMAGLTVEPIEVESDILEGFDGRQEFDEDCNSTAPSGSQINFIRTESTEEPPTEATEESSVEDYMRELLSRMRGDQPSEPKHAAQSTKPPSGAMIPRSSGKPLPQNQTSPSTLGLEEGASADESLEMIDPDSYISLTNAPEKSKNIHALRDLANNSARNAIQKSTRQRYLSSSLLKLAISVIALLVATALFAINGLELNIGLIATLASLMVSAIWGYDAITGLKPLLQSKLVLSPPGAVEPEEA